MSHPSFDGMCFRSPMTSSDAETDSKPIIIIIRRLEFQNKSQDLCLDYVGNIIQGRTATYKENTCKIWTFYICNLRKLAFPFSVHRSCSMFVIPSDANNPMKSAQTLWAKLKDNYLIATQVRYMVNVVLLRPWMFNVERELELTIRAVRDLNNEPELTVPLPHQYWTI